MTRSIDSAFTNPLRSLARIPLNLGRSAYQTIAFTSSGIAGMGEMVGLLVKEYLGIRRENRRLLEIERREEQSDYDARFYPHGVKD